MPHYSYTDIAKEKDERNWGYDEDNIIDAIKRSNTIDSSTVVYLAAIYRELRGINEAMKPLISMKGRPIKRIAAADNSLSVASDCNHSRLTFIAFHALVMERRKNEVEPYLDYIAFLHSLFPDKSYSRRVLRIFSKRMRRYYLREKEYFPDDIRNLLELKIGRWTEKQLRYIEGVGKKSVQQFLIDRKGLGQWSYGKWKSQKEPK